MSDNELTQPTGSALNNCTDCKYYKHLEKLNDDEGECLDPNKVIIRRDGYGRYEYRPTVNAYKDGCKNFQSNGKVNNK